MSERRSPWRINRQIPKAVWHQMREVADALYGGDAGPVLCDGIRMRHAAFLKEKAAGQQSSQPSTDEPEEGAKHGG